MALFGKILLATLFVAGLFVWVRFASPAFTETPRNKELSASVAKTQASEPFEAVGVLMRYQAADLPVYYLLYETRGNAFLRKELRFTQARGCNTQAGDLPCVYEHGVSEPPVPIGTHVRISGVLDAQRIIVSSIAEAPDEDGDYAFLSVRAGDSVETEDLRIELHQVTRESGCNVYTGCFGDSVPRASFSYRAGTREGEKTFVPGMFLNIPDGNLLLLSADEETGTAVFVRAYGSSR